MKRTVLAKPTVAPIYRTALYVVQRFNFILDSDIRRVFGLYAAFITKRAIFGEYNGVRYVLKFKNGYGASVINHDYSLGGKEGLWEVAVLDNRDRLCYNTSVTNDVIGYLTPVKLREVLGQIYDLPKKRGKK